MPTTIQQKVIFKNTTPKALYDLYMNAKLHSLIAGSPVKITQKVGNDFSAHGGYISGKTIHLVKNKLIVQTWRANGWDKNDPDSIFLINLTKKGEDVVLEAIHANLPDKAAECFSNGWNQHYWKPWKLHLAGKPI